MRRILVIKLKHIGDVLLTTPTLHALKVAYPESEIWALVPTETEEVLRGNPDLHGILTFDREATRSLRGALRENGRLLRALRRLRPDLVLEMGQGDREAVLGFLSGAPLRVGYSPRGSGFGGRRFLLTHATSLDHRKHVVESNLDLVRLLGIEPREKELCLVVSPEAEAAIQRRLAAEGVTSGDLLVTIHPVSKWLFKCWRDEGVAALADYLHSKWGSRVAITSGPIRREVAKARRIVSLTCAPILDFIGTLTLQEMAALLRRSRLFVGVDTAPMHMAAAVGTPVVALFGPSGEHNWGPWGEGHIVVTTNLFCRPCGQDGCNGSKRSDCLEMITVEEVIAAVETQLSRRHSEGDFRPPSDARTQPAAGCPSLPPPEEERRVSRCHPLVM